MKKIGFVLALWIPFVSQAESILDRLQIAPSEQSRDFVANKKQFQLHSLLTEQRHSKTWKLSQEIQSDTLTGIQSLLNVDVDISDKILHLSENTALLDQAALSVKKAILQNHKIYIYGCGATGRLAKQMESSFWRPFWKKMKNLPEWEKMKDHFPNIENRLIGEMTGGDRALISSLEGFEDLHLIGKLQLQDHNIQQEDVIFSITEGGETSSVIGTILAASNQIDASMDISQQQKHLYFIYNNPNDVLVHFERSRSVLENPAITKICLATGPQSITGSTRMQATTSETFVMGIILEQAIYDVLEPYLSKEALQELGFYPTTMSERLLSFIPVQEAVYQVQTPISQLTDLESSTYKNGGFSTYFAKDALITMFIDSTERAPTFRLFPLDTYDASPRKSWIQVWTPAENKLNAWENFLGRPFYGLDKEFYERPFSQNIEDPYLKMQALRSLKNAGSEQQFLYDFSYSMENIQTHGPQKNDLGVMVLFGEEIQQLTQPDSFFQSWLKLFSDNQTKIAVILLPSTFLSPEDLALKTIRNLAPEALVLQLPLDDSQDPLGIRRHVGLKMLLNAHSTAVMAKLGRVVGNTMTNVNPGNLKLIGRATFLIWSHVNEHVSSSEGISYADANAVLFNAIEYGERTKKTGQNAEVALCVIRILEALRHGTVITWEKAEEILKNQGLEKYLSLAP
jgi:N-acetylmuramic acid 6-phosphate (MurNAc-6-P) etherase